MQIWDAVNFCNLIISLAHAQKIEQVSLTECIPGALSLPARNLPWVWKNNWDESLRNPQLSIFLCENKKGLCTRSSIDRKISLKRKEIFRNVTALAQHDPLDETYAHTKTRRQVIWMSMFAVMFPYHKSSKLCVVIWRNVCCF